MSTNFYSGYNPEKPTSKVMAPPGGRSNNIFGGYDEPAKPTATNGHATATTTSPVKQPELTPQQCAAANRNHNVRGTNIFGYDQPAAAPAAKPVAPTTAPAASVIPQSHDNAPVKNKKRTGYNPITGESYDVEEKEAPPQQPQQPAEVTSVAPAVTTTTPVEEKPGANNIHTSSRVLQPPGGRSTKLW